VGSCLKKKPVDRATAKQLLEHKFMKKAHQGKEKFVSMLKKLKAESAVPL
jgi:hypothetical protein